MLPRLVEAIPSYVDTVTIYAHEDQAGQRGSLALANALAHVSLLPL
jgi:hypothetical protein